jgi:putative peptidoglycan lipid II flippase
MLIDTVLASFLKAGSISCLYYANRFVQLPLGMFAIGLSQVLLPRLAKRSNDGKKHRKELVNGIFLCSAIIIPATFGLIFFGKPMVDLVFNHGKFTESALNSTYGVLVGYSAGLYFFSLEKIITNAYYSLDEYRFPVVVSAYTLIFNLFVNLLLCFVLGLGVVGLALGTSLTSFLNVSILVKGLERKFRLVIAKEIISSAVSYAIYSIPVAVVSVAGTFVYFSIGSFLFKAMAVLFTILLAASIYMVVLFATKDKFVEVIKG